MTSHKEREFPAKRGNLDMFVRFYRIKWVARGRQGGIPKEGERGLEDTATKQLRVDGER